jgi:hypothetical protein
MKITFSQFLTEGYDLKSLTKRKIPLTDQEREEVMSKKAVWHMGNHNGKPSSAIWKAKDSKGKIVYGCNTHRAFQVRPTLKGAIEIFHSFIKDTA